MYARAELLAAVAGVGVPFRSAGGNATVNPVHGPGFSDGD